MGEEKNQQSKTTSLFWKRREYSRLNFFVFPKSKNKKSSWFWRKKGNRSHINSLFLYLSISLSILSLSKTTWNKKSSWIGTFREKRYQKFFSSKVSKMEEEKTRILSSKHVMEFNLESDLIYQTATIHNPLGWIQWHSRPFLCTASKSGFDFFQLWGDFWVCAGWKSLILFEERDSAAIFLYWLGKHDSLSRGQRWNNNSVVLYCGSEKRGMEFNL